MVRGFLPCVAMVIGIAYKVMVGRKRKDATVGAKGHHITHIIAKNWRPSLAFILGAKKAAIATHGKKIAF